MRDTGGRGAVVLGVSARAPRDGQPPAPAATARPAAEADDAAVRKAAAEFAGAFNEADAQAVADHWTDQGECQDAGGEAVRGRAAIEKLYADFFRDDPGTRVEVRVAAVRFHAPDLAVEDGVLRLVRNRLVAVNCEINNLVGSLAKLGADAVDW